MAEMTAQEPLIPGLPDAISIWEILVRLPPKAVLRSRHVCPAWRRATSTRNFLLAHHNRHPTVPLLEAFSDGSNVGEDGLILDIIPFDLRAGLTTAEELQPLVQYCSRGFRLVASCDGLLALSHFGMEFMVSNPSTLEVFIAPIRRCAVLLGFYLHGPTGEYRLLLNILNTSAGLMQEGHYMVHVLTVGSGQRARSIECPYAERLVNHMVSVDLNGSIHWYNGGMVVAFDTANESFRQILTPTPSATDCDLFKFDGKLGLYTVDERPTLVEIWVMEDYAREIWSRKHRVVLPIEDFRGIYHHTVVVSAGGGNGLFLLVTTGEMGEWLLQIDTSGNLVASFNREGLRPTGVLHKESLVSHGFFL